MKASLPHITAKKIKIKGLVQGVGFRPFIYLLAQDLGLNGYVFNQTDCVVIKIEGRSDLINIFIERLQKEKPEAADIRSVETGDEKAENLDDFEIIKSREGNDYIADISPDIAVCQACLADMRNQKHRINYPFINCTNCGPRFTIIKNYPYDRKNTTMAPFEMCKLCDAEYHSILDRRFHAQPIACNNCGPGYALYIQNRIENSFSEILNVLNSILQNNGVIAIKSLGGYNLMCDATSNQAVDKIREIKKRDTKPFAVMFRDPEVLKNYCHVDEAEERELTSWRRPIVILQAKGKPLAEGVSSGFSTIGALLPYLPLHYLLFEKILTDALVFTSGNISDEPIIIDNQLARDTFGAACDAVLTNNRDIFNRTDDSVLKVIRKQPFVFRRARGYVPNPIELEKPCEGILAAGAELVNAFCLGKGTQAIMSQYMGDLKNYETYEFFRESIETYKKLFRFTPELIVADLHPDYLATRYAHEQGVPVLEIQHHYAHVASCMAEHQLNEPVIGVSFDGTGLGTDGKIWGSEFMIADFHRFERLFHFEYIPIPGGDIATKQPWRTALSYLYRYYGSDLLNLNLTFLKQIDNQVIQKITESIDKRINCPDSCSAGRLFDAVSVILGCIINSGFHAEAPMRLEDLVISDTRGSYNYSINNSSISFKPAMDEILDDLGKDIRPEVIAAKFHNTIAGLIRDTVLKIKEASGIKKVALSGGTFQNKYLVEMLFPMLEDANFEVFYQEKIPCNDGGIALGQLAVAANRK